ncbi:hypothetical protein D3C76_1160440 [compost metagenome]
MNKAMPATPRVRLLSAVVAAKVRLKISLDQRFKVACSTTRLSSRAKRCCKSAFSAATRSGARFRLILLSFACARCPRSQSALTSRWPLGLP